MAARFSQIVADDKAGDALRFPARQRLSQILSRMRREALNGNGSEDPDTLAEDIVALNLGEQIENDMKVFLSWDTDRTDVDLWVINPAGEKVYYSHKKGRFGGQLFRDVTRGYGPESFTAHDAAKGRYEIIVHFFGTRRKAFAEARGEVIVMLNEGRPNETRHVLPYRLSDRGQTVSVATIDVQ